MRGKGEQVEAMAFSTDWSEGLPNKVTLGRGLEVGAGQEIRMLRGRPSR